jgi:hypothetical protein
MHSINNFMMNLIAALGEYCFFEKKPAIKMRSKFTEQVTLS